VHYLMVCQENSPDSYQIESQLLTWCAFDSMLPRDWDSTILLGK